MINQKEFVQDRLLHLGADDNQGGVFLVPHQNYTEIIFFRAKKGYVSHSLPLIMLDPLPSHVEAANFSGSPKAVFETLASFFQQLSLALPKHQHRLNNN